MEKEQGSSVGNGFKMMMVMGGILVIACVILGIVNLKREKKQREIAAQSVITVVQGGQEQSTFGPNEVLQVPQEIFEASPLEGETSQEVVQYTGAPLAQVLHLAQVDLTDVATVTLRSADGSFASFSQEELQAEENIYLVYGMNKKPLGLPTEGGNGPFMLVLRQESPELGRWVRCVSVVELS